MDTVQKIRTASLELGQERLKASSGLGQDPYNSKRTALLKQHGQAMLVSLEWDQIGMLTRCRVGLVALGHAPRGPWASASNGGQSRQACLLS